MKSCCTQAGAGIVDTPARPFRIALVGNPNVGKSSLFNLLTGMHQHVGNWPGKTVERRDGLVMVDGRSAVVTDLPGVYSLTPYTLEESVARAFLLGEVPDLIIDAVDSTHLERNLYLTLELLELGLPVVIALTMSDVARHSGVRVDAGAMERLLGVPVVPVAVPTGEGIATLLEWIARATRGEVAAPAPGSVRYSPELEAAIEEVEDRMPAGEGKPRRWLALKVLEEDPEIRERWLPQRSGPWDEGLPALPGGALAVADARYLWIQQHLPRLLSRGRARSAPDPSAVADRIDRWVTHRVFGLPITLGLLALSIWGAFRVATPLQEWIEAGFAWLGAELAAAAGLLGAPAWVTPLVTNGIVGGIATVAAFAPLVAVFFLFSGLLEDSGYLARAAFVLDRLLGRFGLQGRAGIGLLIGYGCNVPSVMAARTASSQRVRLLSILVAPLIICSARLVVISFVASAFFPGGGAAWVVAGIYGLGAALVVLAARILHGSVLRGEEEPFFIELPPYRLPRVRNVALYAWQQSVHFLSRALTIIAPMTVVVWALSYFPAGSVETSVLGRLGQWLAPAGRQLGLDWQMVVALFTGFLAKEGTLSSLSVLYAHDGAPTGLATALRAAMSIPQALSFLLFFAFYTPCLATTTTIYQETRSVRWTLVAMLYPLALAALLAGAAYRIASIPGIHALLATRVG
ncbi:MAG: ferrous iron transport protein B [Limnochordaceae bacterium]|nr:ferrous iron transport protein B [Limnochordaceae bacterium]